MTPSSSAWRPVQKLQAKGIAPRRATLRQCAAVMRANADALAETLCREQGKPFAKAKREVMDVARWFDYIGRPGDPD